MRAPLINSHSFMQTLTNQKSTTVSSWLLIGLNLHAGFARTLKVLESFKIKIQGLESPWKLQSVLESPWISVLTLSNKDSQVSKRSKHRKTYQGKIAHVVEEPKKTDSRLFFALNGVLEKWEMSPWKSLKIPWIFCSKKGTNPVHERMWINSKR